MVRWSGIQNVLEQAESDVLILLDCCHSGTATASEGDGVTELISACAYNSQANGVGSYSFTKELIIELQQLSQQPSFTVAELYRNIFCRIQSRRPEDEGRRERHPAPIHLSLTQDHPIFPRTIQIYPPTRKASPACVNSAPEGLSNSSTRGNAGSSLKASTITGTSRIDESKTMKTTFLSAIITTANEEYLEIGLHNTRIWWTTSNESTVALVTSPLPMPRGLHQFQHQWPTAKDRIFRRRATAVPKRIIYRYSNQKIYRESFSQFGSKIL
jgi:hypothetical protein